MGKDIKKRTLKIYAAGGAGCNMAQDILNIPKGAAGFPEYEITRIDTSMSNIDTQNTELGNYFFIPGVEGAGKDRKFGYDIIVPHIDKILIDNKPADFNIVIFGLSGGSGSTLGPLLVSELLKRNEATIAICIGSTASGIEAHNTLKTISTLQNISVNVLKKPLVCSFYINSEETTRDVVDSQIDNDVRALALLVSGSNKEMDATDLGNWLGYTGVTNIPPQLVDLVIHCVKPESKDIKEMNAISVASLLPNISDSVIDLGQPYSCVGYMPDSVVNASDATMYPMHFIITNGLLNNRMEELTAISTKYSETKQKLMEAAVLHTDNESNEDGMTF